MAKSEVFAILPVVEEFEKKNMFTFEAEEPGLKLICKRSVQKVPSNISDQRRNHF